MGMRGPGARPMERPKPLGQPETATLFDLRQHHPRPKPTPWENPELTRAERVNAFVESLSITAGRHAGKPFILWDWQRDIIREIYAEDARQIQP